LDVTTLRAPAGFEKEAMRGRTVVFAAALAAIAAGVAAFVIGLRQPIDTQVSYSNAGIELTR
jgi:hypothetical protein